MGLLSRIRALLFVACVAALLAPSSAHAITRENVLRRAEVWLQAAVPYSQSGYATDSGVLALSAPGVWRRDCSGFTSMCFDLRRADGSALSLDTASLRSQVTTITGKTSVRKAALKPGDLILRPKDLKIDGKRVAYGHAVIFVRWVDAAKTRYVGYHQSSGRGRTVAQEIVYPFWSERGFAPYRYKRIEDGRLRKSRTWVGPYVPPSSEAGVFPAGVVGSSAGTTSPAPAQ